MPTDAGGINGTGGVTRGMHKTLILTLFLRPIDEPATCHTIYNNTI
jgi:hypothetical protein